MKGVFKDIKLTEIVANPKNYRTNFSGPKFDELVESIREKGVVQPILVRPKNKKFEIIFGERRFRAAKVVSKKKGAKKTIPAIIRDIGDDEAYDIMVLENLQREDLTEYEEAKGFALYLKKNGDEALPHLAKRTGIKPSYIRRRVSVLNLPEPILEAWDKGEIRYGYLEQLTRLDDETAIMEWFEEIMNGYSIDSVRDLKREIDSEAIAFKYALFDLEKSGCLGCGRNTDVQLRLFEIDAQKTKCLKPACFKQKQTAWLTDNWNDTTFRKKHKTSGFRFTDDMDRNQCHFFNWDSKPGKACFKCDAFVTVFSGVQLNIHFDRLCIGENSCFKKTCQTPKKTSAVNSETDGSVPDEKPRVEWHGVHFREIFFKEVIPQRFTNVTPGEAQAVRLALFALIKSQCQLQQWFMETYGEASEDSSSWISDEALFKPIEAMDLAQANQALKAVTLQAVMENDFLAEGRYLVGDHIGIDLSKEWAITEEYLGKKHIPEILGMGERLGIFSDPKAKSYLTIVIGKKSFDKCKKSELIKVFLESGVELIGKVPDEILI